MKAILVGLILVTAAGCYLPRDLQAEMVQTELIRIDTVNRTSMSDQKQQLTWRDSYNVVYTALAPMTEMYVVGTKMIMLRPR